MVSSVIVQRTEGVMHGMKLLFPSASAASWNTFLSVVPAHLGM